MDINVTKLSPVNTELAKEIAKYEAERKAQVKMFVAGMTFFGIGLVFYFYAILAIVNAVATVAK